MDTDADAAARVVDWGKIACEGNEVGPVLQGNYGADVAANCQLKINGTRGEKRVFLLIFPSSTALDTYKSTLDCDGSLKVIVPDWVSETYKLEPATALQEAGGELLCA